MTMAGEELEGLLAPVLAIAEEAGRKIVAIYNSEYSVEHKDDRSPLTEADLAAHEVIVSGLEGLTPEIPVLSEESADIPYSERRDWRTYWLVDPLDGTREFIKRNGEFTVNIALIDDHRPVLGVIVVPVSGVSYYASRGHGAYRRSPDRAPERLRVRPLDPSHLVVAGSRSHAGPDLAGFLQRLGQPQLVSMGSSLKFCLVAEGKADVYARLGPTSEWDTAAAHCIVEEAGGIVTDTAMQALRYNTKESILNPYFFVSADRDHDWSQYLSGSDAGSGGE